MIIILFQIIRRIKSAAYSFCSVSTTMYQCKKRNANLTVDDSLIYQRPIFAGKCCWHSQNDTQGYGSCRYSEESDVFKWNEQHLSCFTGVEKCLAIESVPYKDYSYCYSIPTEQPYSCCYIGNEKRSFCFPLNINNKKIFGKTLTLIRAKYGDFDEKIHDFSRSNLRNVSLCFLRRKQ